MGYVRVSTEEQANEGWSLPAQRRRIAAYCEAMGWELVEVFADEGVSARAGSHRPQFEAMRDYVLKDGVSHVVSLKLARLGRSAKDLLVLYNELEAEGVAIVFIEEQIDTSTPMGKLFRTILAGVAEFESDELSVRVKIGMEEAKRQGKHVGRPVEMDSSTEDRILKLRAEGNGYRVIADTLNADGIPTTRGGRRWYPSTVQAALHRLERSA